MATVIAGESVPSRMVLRFSCAVIATENELSDEDVASAKAQLEAAGLATEVLEEERPVPPELAELLEFLQSMGGRVTVLKI